MSNSRKSRLLRAAARLFLAALVAIVVLEGLLRLGGLATAPEALSPAQKKPNTRIVLCAGDSFVYGVGGEPFPKQLQEILNERQHTLQFDVINLGVPGTGTSQMLNTLEEQLKTYKPHYLIILSGANNSWLQYDLAKNRRANPLSRLKLWKLLRLLARPQKTPEKTPAPPASCKSSFPTEQDWFNATRVELSTAAGSDPQSSRALQNYARKVEAEFGTAERLINQRQASDAGLRLQKLLNLRFPKIPGAERVPDRTAQMREIIKFRAAVMLGHLYSLTDRPRAVDGFKQALTIRPDYLYGYLRVASLYRVSSDSDNFLKYIHLLLSKDPAFVPAYIELTWYHYLRGEHDQSTKYFTKALELAPCSEYTLTHMPFSYSELAKLLPPLEKSLPEIKNNPAYIQHVKLARRLRKLDDDEKAMEELTETDLITAGRLAKQYKAKLTISSYPERSLPGALRAARKLNIPYLDFVPLFKISFKDRREYIAFDKDHCNSEGYRLMAEYYADLIIASETPDAK